MRISLKRVSQEFVFMNSFHLEILSGFIFTRLFWLSKNMYVSIDVNLRNYKNFRRLHYLQINFSRIFSRVRWGCRLLSTSEGILSGGIRVKILEVVDWSQVSNQSSQLESAAAIRISCSLSLEASSSFLKLLRATSRFLKQQPEPESVVTEIRWWKTKKRCILQNKSLNLLDILKYKPAIL